MDAKTTFSENVFSSHILHLLHMIFVEVNEQIIRLSLVITSFQVLL